MADDLHTLSAPYALDALTPDERAQFEEHLRTCDRCQAELAGLQDAAASLAFSVEGPAPPSALRAAILDAARAERPNVVPLRPRRTLTAVAAALAVAASVAAVGFGVWAASLHNSLSQLARRGPRARRPGVPSPSGRWITWGARRRAVGSGGARGAPPEAAERQDVRSVDRRSRR